VVGRK